VQFKAHNNVEKFLNMNKNVADRKTLRSTNKTRINLACFLEIKYKSFNNTHALQIRINPLTPIDHYSGRTAPLTSKRCILYIY